MRVATAVVLLTLAAMAVVLRPPAATVAVSRSGSIPADLPEEWRPKDGDGEIERMAMQRCMINGGIASFDETARFTGCSGRRGAP